MSTATSGRAREHLVRDHLIALGYPAIMRAAGSKGAADLLHGHPIVGAVLVQVGTANKALGPADRNRFCEAAELACAVPVLATVFRGGATPDIRYLTVTRDLPRTWQAWEPTEERP